jgi:hypothetical protein
VDRLAKVAHFVPVNMTYTRPQLEELYNSRVVCFHGVPMRIVLGARYRNPIYFEVLGKVTLNYAYPFELQFCLLPSDRGIDQESKSNSQGYAESLCSIVRKKME